MQGTDPRARRPAVSRGHTRRCRSGSTDIRLHRKWLKGRRWDLVRCDVPLTSCRGPELCLPFVLYDRVASCSLPPRLRHLQSPICPQRWRSRPASRCRRSRCRPPIPQTGKAGGPGRAEPTPRSIAQASGRIGRGQAHRADRGGADAAQHQCGCRERLAPRPDRAGDTRDRRGHLGRDHAGAGLSHRVGGCAGRGRCHLRRQSGRARGFLHASASPTARSTCSTTASRSVRRT